MAAHGSPAAPGGGAAAAGPPRRRPHDESADDEIAPRAPPEAAPEADDDDSGAVAWDVWCIAQGVAAACVGAVESAQPDAACVDAQPPGAREQRPARLLARGCMGEPLRCPAEVEKEAPTVLPPRPPPPDGWEYVGPEDDDLRPVGGWDRAPRGVPLEASMAAATRKAEDASAVAARERVKEGLPLTEDIFFPPERPAARAASQPAPEKPLAVSPTRGAEVLQPRSGAAARAAASK